MYICSFQNLKSHFVTPGNHLYVFVYSLWHYWITAPTETSQNKWQDFLFSHSLYTMSHIWI